MADESAADALRVVLRRELQAALKGRRTAEVAALRGVIAAIDNAEAVRATAVQATPMPASSAHIAGAGAGVGSTEATRRELTVEELRGIVERELAGLEDQATSFDALGRVSEAEAVRCRADAIRRIPVAGGSEAAATDPAALPFIDAPRIVISAPPDRCWAALLSVVGGGMAGTPAQAMAAVLGCADRSVRGPRDEPGSTLAGFHVAYAEPPRRWRLEGAHRFSRYSLEFRLESIGPGHARLSAESRALFPGWHGTCYRALVVGSRGHRLAVRRMLQSVKRRAETEDVDADGTARSVEE